uniref:NADH-ubiquinone oxidoreductase chain 4L n=1 Tax=Megalophaedusa aratorum TaxID=1885741 RepID=A0A224AB70_9EUPU|nr:NADH dehydrogenase subunit 4L [Megalophaedusa aratorum]
MILYWSLLALLMVVSLLFFYSRNHYLSALLFLEIMVLFSLVISFFLILDVMSQLTIYIMLLTLGVCEASLGLALLMSCLKENGSDLIKAK